MTAQHAQPGQQWWWCDACGTTHPVSGGWYALWLTSSGGCSILPNVTLGDVNLPWREEVYACGQGSALVLVERFLHTGSFAQPQEIRLAPKVRNTAIENF